MWEWLKGKKTYGVAILVGIGAAAQFLGFNVPEWAWLLLNAIGLGSIRDALKK